MIIGCITGPDFSSVKKQLQKAEHLCDAIEIRSDLFTENFKLPPIDLPIIDCREFPTYHNFEKTPEDLDALLDSLPKGKIIKIATKANCTSDSLRMLDLVRRRKNVAGMCMGPLGAITRILAPVYGSPMTFASLGKEAAPGQLLAEELIYRYRYKNLSKSTRVYGLIGHPVSQSPSHITHNAYFQKHGLDAVYVKMEILKEEMPLFFKLVKRLRFSGLSVTTPFKQQVLEQVDQVEEKVRAIGAINTLTFEGEKVLGANTDADGALDVLEKRFLAAGKKIVILGEGGASKAIAFEARKRGAVVTLCSKKLGNLKKIPPYDVLINTIPVEIEHEPIANTTIYDINFNREKSCLAQKAREKDCQLIFGEEMFEAQAKYQFANWGLISKDLANL